MDGEGRRKPLGLTFNKHLAVYFQSKLAVVFHRENFGLLHQEWITPGQHHTWTQPFGLPLQR